MFKKNKNKAVLPETENVNEKISVDFKFFNTYGPSKTYALEDQKTLIGNIDITMKFKLSIKDASDISIKDEVFNLFTNVSVAGTVSSTLTSFFFFFPLDVSSASAVFSSI